MHFRIRAISRPIHDLLTQHVRDDHPTSARVLGSFRRAINLMVTIDGAADCTVVTFIVPDVAIGPFHIMVDALPAAKAGRTHRLWREEATLHIGPWSFQLSRDTTIWAPRPTWDMIGIRSRQLAHLARAVQDMVTAPPDTPTTISVSARLPVRHRDGLSTAVARADLPTAREHGAALAGRGPGLTPSGDDYLAGVMLALWATHHAHRQELCDTICDAALKRTTRLSRAYLEAARHGEADESWHALLRTLSREDGDALRLRQAAATIRQHGATSGLDMLVGFVDGATGPGAPTQLH